MTAYKLLLVEDDQDLGNLLVQYLRVKGFAIDRVFNGGEARAILAANRYDLLILDVMLPGENGFSLAAALKEAYPGIPFLFLTAKKMAEDIRKNLQLGADDYIIKPFDADELALRINNILRRVKGHGSEADEIISIGSYLLNTRELLLTSTNATRLLTEKESCLLAYLYFHREKLIKRDMILNYLWEEADFFSGRSMDVFISRLRKYLADDPHISTERKGHRLPFPGRLTP